MNSEKENEEVQVLLRLLQFTNESGERAVWRSLLDYIGYLKTRNACPFEIKQTRRSKGEAWLELSVRDNNDITQFHLSYQDDVFPWLKDHVLCKICQNDVYFQTAVVQYMDYLVRYLNCGK